MSSRDTRIDIVPRRIKSRISLLSCVCTPQDAARAPSREAPRARGHARGDGSDPGGYAGGGPDSPGPVEAAAPPLVQRE